MISHAINCQTITGRLIADFGPGWEGTVVELISGAGRQQFRSRKLSANKDETLEERIVSDRKGKACLLAHMKSNRQFNVSLAALRGDDAPKVRRLFQYMAIFKEDTIIPASTIEVLWRSQESQTLLQAARQGFSTHSESGFDLGGGENGMELRPGEGVFKTTSKGWHSESAVTIRRYASKLLDRSLLLGSMIAGLKIQ